MAGSVDFDLSAIERGRAELQALESKQAALRLDIATRAAEVAELLRTAPTSARLTQAQARLARLVDTRAALQSQHGDLRATVDSIAVGLLNSIAESDAVTTLDARFPVALLPVRIESRFGPNATSLEVRIYPDQIHLDAHEPGFTPGEREAAEWYWEQRWPNLADAALADAAWQTLAGRFRPGRARYLVDTLVPTNRTAAPTGRPAFPDTDTRAGSWTRAVEATSLPERWVAVGYQGDVEVFRVWSGRVPDRLAAGPTPAAEESDDTPPDAGAVLPAVHDAFRWAFDLESARAVGMAISIGDRDMASGHRLADGLSRLVVFGVDWTLSPDKAAASLTSLLAGHAATGDLAFVAPGTPTNNTGTVRAGFSTAPDDQVAEWAPPVIGTDPDTSADVAAGQLAAALGIAAQTLAVAPGAGGRHGQVAGAVLDSLWEGTGGYFASEMLDPLGSDGLTMRVREHAAAHLRPSGPLPAIRIGPQPYGVLPVVAANYSPTAGDAAEETIARVATTLRGLWQPLTDQVPHLDRIGDDTDLDSAMLDLLQRTPVPWSMRWREMIPPPQWTATEWAARFRTFQAPLLYTIMNLLGVTGGRAARLQYLTAAADSNPLSVPLVQKGDSNTGYLAEIADLVRAGTEGRRELNLRQNSVALLEALLAFAAVQEMDKAASAELTAGFAVADLAAAGFARRGVRTPDLVRVEQATTVTSRAFTSARELVSRTAPNSTVAVHDAVAARVATTSVADLLNDRTAPAHSVARFLAALDVLADAPADDIEWAFRGVLDLYSTRLDAWLTSLAAARLARHRSSRPTGVHLGCYGWVDDLRPDVGAAAESLGYTMTPSLGHAVTAAILRSGREVHAESGAFALDLGSARVREAVALLEGVAAGQSIAALVGYRIERRMREAGLAEFAVPFRLVAPLQSRSTEHDEPVESVAARDVVDGVRLLSLFAGPAAAWTTVLNTTGAIRRRTEVETVLTAVAANYDAVADVLFAEAVHQTAAGNLDRAGAATGALDRQERPVEPEVIRTPRDGIAVTHRVLVSLQKKTRTQGWPSRGVRGTAEPRLDAWLGDLFGDPTRLVVAGRLRRRGTGAGDPDVVTQLDSVSAADLGLSPLPLALAAQRPAQAGGSELDVRIRAALAALVDDLRADDVIECDEFSVLHTVAGWGAQLVGSSRALAPSDLAAAPTTSVIGAGSIDVAEIADRVAATIPAVQTARDAMATASGGPRALRTALLRVSELVGDEAIPIAVPGTPDEAESLRTQAAAVATLLSDRLVSISALAADPLDAGEDALARQLALGRLALGAHQPLLPICRLDASAEPAASAADRAGLLGGDETVAVSWLQRASLVRPELDALCGLLTHAEADGRDIVADVAVTQLPHRPGARWCALPFGVEGAPPAGTVGMVIVAPDGFDPGKVQAGLFVDAWAEVIPSPDHTAGLAFHYDAPGARPPQAIVLAVHPEPDPDRWDIETLLATVAETADLAMLRALSLKEIDAFAGLVPALLLPNNYTRDVPSVSLKWLTQFAGDLNLLTAVHTGITGK